MVAVFLDYKKKKKNDDGDGEENSKKYIFISLEGVPKVRSSTL